MDHPDYKYQPRRKKMKGISGHCLVDEKQSNVASATTAQTPRKAGRRAKKHIGSEEMDDNDSDKSFSQSMNYNSYDHRSRSDYTNYNGMSSFSSYMPSASPPPVTLNQAPSPPSMFTVSSTCN